MEEMSPNKVVAESIFHRTNEKSPGANKSMNINKSNFVNVRSWKRKAKKEWNWVDLVISWLSKNKTDIASDGFFFSIRIKRIMCFLFFCLNLNYNVRILGLLSLIFSSAYLNCMRKIKLKSYRIKVGLNQEKNYEI